MFTLLNRGWGLLLVLVFGPMLLMPGCQKDDETPNQAGRLETPAVQPPSAKPVTFEGESVIYVVGPLSGRHAEKGQAQAAGARLAAREQNERGGLLNHKIVIKILNDAGNPQGALAAVKQVMDAASTGENLIGIIMHEGSDPRLESVREMYSKHDSGLNGIVVIPASTEPLPADINDRKFFRLSAPNLFQASEIAYVFQERNLHDIVMIHTETAYGKALSDEFKKAIKSLDVRAIAAFEIIPDASSYTDVANRVREINPAGLFFAGGDIERKLNIKECFWLFTHNLSSFRPHTRFPRK